MKRKFDRQTASKSGERASGGTGGSNPMSRNDRIEREVEETLRSYGPREILSARPDFYARLQARIRKERGGRRPIPTQSSRLGVLIPAALLILIVLNIVVAVSILRRSETGGTGRQTEMTAFAEEYGLKTSPISPYWK
jgi:hypothetical protein